MDDKKYTITLTDGTVLKDLRLNGNNFISSSGVSEDIFLDNCAPVVIDDGETKEIHERMELIQITEMSDGYWFVLRDIPDDEMRNIKMQSDIEYIAMMSGIEL